jgi:hypothetical protein
VKGPRTRLWIPCLLGALALAMFALVWRIQSGPTRAETRASQAALVESERLARIRAYNSERDSILLPIVAEIESGAGTEWSGDYYAKGAEGVHLALGMHSYAWLSSCDIRLAPSGDPTPAIWPEEALEEHGTLQVEQHRIRLLPQGEAFEQAPHEIEFGRDAGGRIVTGVGAPRATRHAAGIGDPQEPWILRLPVSASSTTPR